MLRRAACAGMTGCMIGAWKQTPCTGLCAVLATLTACAFWSSAVSRTQSTSTCSAPPTPLAECSRFKALTLACCFCRPVLTMLATRLFSHEVAKRFGLQCVYVFNLEIINANRADTQSVNLNAWHGCAKAGEVLLACCPRRKRDVPHSLGNPKKWANKTSSQLGQRPSCAQCALCLGRKCNMA